LNVTARTRRGSRPPDVTTTSGAAEILGVSEMTLRWWDKAGKSCVDRQLVNRYRVYRRAHVMKLRKQAERGKAA